MCLIITTGSIQIKASTLLFGLVLILTTSCTKDSPKKAKEYLQISGIYPHLTAYNQPADTSQRRAHQEAGIGAVVPWAEHLWYITYPPHQRRGSNDKLYMVDEDMNLTIREESVGGTHANRMIHKESAQLIIGPYFIDTLGQVRAADLTQLEGRLTATTRHLTDPANMVYFYDMEGHLYEVNVRSLKATKLFEKPVPGWHGKGAYVGQKRLIVANNGEHQGHEVGYSRLEAGGPAASPEEAGVLAEWDGSTWKIIERKQFTDVMGPGGLYGNQSDRDPVWSIGWDKRSLILKVLQNNKWYSYRLPKASHTFDPRHGWFTEWPRIRAISEDQWMMAMHATLFEFPQNFNIDNTGGIQPISTHLRYIPDFGYWKDRIFLAADDASRLQNPIVGQPQSNIWFGTKEDLKHFGPKNGWGGIWINDPIEANQNSEAILLNGYQERVLHLVNHSNTENTFILFVDKEGNNQWVTLKIIKVAPKSYHYELLSRGLQANWLRIRSEKAGTATAYLHFSSPRAILPNEASIFEGLAGIEKQENTSKALIRPAGHKRSLQIYYPEEENAYWEMDLDAEENTFIFTKPDTDRSEEVKQVAALNDNAYQVDENSIILQDNQGKRYRLPKGDIAYENLWQLGHGRVLREVQSERYLANIHGMFYEIPRVEGASKHLPDYQKIKPISRHNKAIVDFCSWRGLLVLSGVQNKVEGNKHIFQNESGQGLWFGAIDDLWKFAKPTGKGGPWTNEDLQAGAISDPFLMTGFDKKSLRIAHQTEQSIRVQVEVAIHHEANSWQLYKSFDLAPKGSVNHEFPKGFHAHWVRFKVDKGAKSLSALFKYE